MPKLTLLGLSLCLGGLLTVGFQKLSTLMNTLSTGGVQEATTIKKLVDPDHLNWINNISVDFVKTAADYIITMPLYILLISLGVICLMFKYCFKD
jgi:hypothetical protein